MKNLKQWLAASALACGAMVAAAPAAIASPLVLGGGWTILDQVMASGDFFKAPDGGTGWTLDCPVAQCAFYITDLFVASDRFEVYDGGVLIETTPAMAGLTSGFQSGPWTSSADVAMRSGSYSAAVIMLDLGVHSLQIRDIDIPLSSPGGAPFPDGTVAFRVVAVVPEPAPLALLGLAFVGLGFVRRKTH